MTVNPVELSFWQADHPQPFVFLQLPTHIMFERTGVSPIFCGAWKISY